jgi:hypothetical protein
MEPLPRHRPRYRWRTWMRGHMPWAFVDLFPKGLRDCGQHHWFNIDDVTDGCYHCEVGERPHQEKQIPLDDDFRVGLVREVARGCRIAMEVLTIMRRQDREHGRPFWHPPADSPRGERLFARVSSMGDAARRSARRLRSP